MFVRKMALKTLLVTVIHTATLALAWVLRHIPGSFVDNFGKGSVGTSGRFSVTD